MDTAATIANSGSLRFAARLRDRVTAAFTAIKQPERWVLLSGCDWYPDPSHYPTNHAALLKLDAAATDHP